MLVKFFVTNDAEKTPDINILTQYVQWNKQTQAIRESHASLVKMQSNLKTLNTDNSKRSVYIFT